MKVVLASIAALVFVVFPLVVRAQATPEPEVLADTWEVAWAPHNDDDPRVSWVADHFCPEDQVNRDFCEPSSENGVFVVVSLSVTNVSDAPIEDIDEVYDAVLLLDSEG